MCMSSVVNELGASMVKWTKKQSQYVKTINFFDQTLECGSKMLFEIGFLFIMSFIDA